MFKQIYIERDIKNSSYAQNILKKFPKIPVIEINSYDEVWGKFKKPYLQKRTNLNLFIARKKGQIVKEAPEAYGQKGEPHYYFIHAYNCIYECQYCFLQGYFHTPDIVLFVNHDEICEQIEGILKEQPNAWFHAGEFSDSLALSQVTNELQSYFDLFKQYPEAKLELRTKSANISALKKLEPLGNVFVSFSLSSERNSKEFDLKTPSTLTRLKVMKELAKQGFQIGIHLDPIIYSPELKNEYSSLICLMNEIPKSSIHYISIGVVRYTKDVYRQVEMNYPDSKLTSGAYTKSFDQKVRYSRPMRSWILNTVEELLLEHGYKHNKIYRCMEL